MPGIQPIVNDLLQVRTVCTTGSQVSLNVLHYGVTAVTGLGCTLQEIAASFENTVSDLYLAILSTKGAWRGVGVKNLTPPASVEQFSIANAGGGAGSANQAPSQVTALIALYTLKAGRGNRGRIYPGFLDMAMIASTGELTPAGVVKVQDLATAIPKTIAMVGAGGNTTMTLRVKHSISAANPSPGLANEVVQSLVARSQLATQRRRGDFGKANITPF